MHYRYDNDVNMMLIIILILLLLIIIILHFLAGASWGGSTFRAFHLTQLPGLRAPPPVHTCPGVTPFLCTNLSAPLHAALKFQPSFPAIVRARAVGRFSCWCFDREDNLVLLLIYYRSSWLTRRYKPVQVGPPAAASRLPLAGPPPLNSCL